MKFISPHFVYSSRHYMRFCTGLFPGGKDVLSELVDGQTTTKSWTVTELGLPLGIQHYTSVVAINMAGLAAVAYGDGFTVSFSICIDIL